MNLNTLIKISCSELKIKRVDLASRMGYTDIPKALNKISKWASKGTTDNTIISKLANALEVDEITLIDAIIETYSENQAEIDKKNEKIYVKGREDFLPMLIAMFAPPNRPTSFLSGGATYRQRLIVYSKNFLELSETEQFAKIKLDIQIHYAEKNGIVLSWGEITHYRYVNKFYIDENEPPILFDINGDRINEDKSKEDSYSHSSYLLTYYAKPGHYKKYIDELNEFKTSKLKTSLQEKVEKNQLQKEK